MRIPTFPHIVTRLVAAVLLLALSGCGDDGPAAPPSVAEVTVVSGDGQTATVGSTLTLVVRAEGASGGGIEGTQVSWTVVDGGGSIASATTATGADGEATNVWTLGTTAGTQTVRATSGSASATFSATAESGAAASVVVTPTTATLVSLGETLQLSVEVADEFGNQVTDPGTATFESDDETVVTVAGDGVVTAVADGSATVTAGVGDLQGSAAITVAQQTAAVTVTPSDVAITVGAGTTLTATAEDALGNAVADASFTWSAEPDGPLVLEPNEGGTEVEVTGAEEATVTVTATTGSRSGSATVVVEPSMAFEPEADVEIEGTLDATTVTIPEGVTVTATGDLNILASDHVTIAGNVVGDCVDVSLLGEGDLVVTGSIDTSCEGDPGPGERDLNLVTVGSIDLDGAELMSGGAVLVTNDTDFAASVGLPLPTGGSGPARVPSDPDCDLANTVIQADHGWAPGFPGHATAVICTYEVTLRGGVRISAGDGRRGLDAFTGDFATATAGGGGGSVTIESKVRRIRFFKETGGLQRGNLLTAGNGGDGGNAAAVGAAPGGSANAIAGSGGRAGGVGIVTGGNGADIRVEDPGALEIDVGSGGHGGFAKATGADGLDATGSEPATDGGIASAAGGAGGDTGDAVAQLAGGLFSGAAWVTYRDVTGGNGGHATAEGGDGGNGNTTWPGGGRGGGMIAFGGDAGTLRFTPITGGVDPASVRVPPGPLEVSRAGSAGDATVRYGRGGKGGPRCEAPLALGGDGGMGGNADVKVGATAAGGSAGTVTVDPGTGDGGEGGRGAPGGAGGDGGNGPSATNAFRKGLDGADCGFMASVELAILSDVNGHEPFIGALQVTALVLHALSGTELTVPGTTAWGPTSILLGLLANQMIPFTGTGVGTVAGFPGVTHTLEGHFLTDENGKFVGIDATLTLDAENDKLPANNQGERNPAIYKVEGSVLLDEEPSGGG